MGPKNGLKIKLVNANHFSSGKSPKDCPTGNRIVVRLLQAKNLLASDKETGKSDPVGFIWVGPRTIEPCFDPESVR